MTFTITPEERFNWFRAPLNPFDPDSIVYCHRSWRDHPIIGFGQGAPKRLTNEKGQASRFEAFATLSWQRCAELIAPGFDRNPGSFILADNRAHVPNVAADWNWAVTPCKAFLSDLLAAGLIDENLFHALSINLPRGRKGIRDALPRATRSAVLAKTSGKCVYCGVILSTKGGRPDSYEPDHVLPVKEGGSDDVANLVPSCRSCNSKKRAKTLVKFVGGGE